MSVAVAVIGEPGVQLDRAVNPSVLKRIHSSLSMW